MNKDVTVTDDWQGFLSYFREQDKDIYFTQDYIRLHENGENKAECFVYRQADRLYLYPYLKSEIKLMQGGYYDFETPNGYGGPIANDLDEDFISRSYRAFSQTCKENKIICGFARLHPLLKNYHCYPDEARGSVTLNRKTVAMELGSTEDEIWSQQLHPKHRNSIRKAENLGLRFVIDGSLSNLGEFINLYNQRMRKKKAGSDYFFNQTYYDRIKEWLMNNSFLGMVYLKAKLISAALFLYYGIYGHYHLAASLEEYDSCCPNNFLVYNAALYLKKKGIQLLHLGGGSSPDEQNSLFKFKKRFSNKFFDFFIGKMIFDQTVYKKLCQSWEDKFPEKKDLYKERLLRYRF